MDDEDYEWLSGFTWYPRFDKNTIYAQRTNSEGTMHQLITGFSMTDHKNGIGLDNLNYRPKSLGFPVLYRELYNYTKEESMKVVLRGRQAQCPICDRVFTSDAMAEKHKPYTNPKTDTCKDPATLSMVERDRGWTLPVPDDVKWWGATAAYEPRGPQALTCVNCGTTWERPAQRGRKPRLCADCKALAP